MAGYIEIETTELKRLVDCLQYVIDRYRDSDSEMAEHLKRELDDVLGHFYNERSGCGVAAEIELILGFIEADEGL